MELCALVCTVNCSEVFLLTCNDQCHKLYSCKFVLLLYSTDIFAVEHIWHWVIMLEINICYNSWDSLLLMSLHCEFIIIIIITN